MFVKIIIQPNFLEISTTYGVVTIIIHVCLLADNWLISSLHTQCIISKSNVKLCSMQQYECHYFLQYNVYNMGSLDISMLNNQGLGKYMYYQPRTFTLNYHHPDYSRCHKNFIQ